VNLPSAGVNHCAPGGWGSNSAVVNQMSRCVTDNASVSRPGHSNSVRSYADVADNAMNSVGVKTIAPDNVIDNASASRPGESILCTPCQTHAREILYLATCLRASSCAVSRRIRAHAKLNFPEEKQKGTDHGGNSRFSGSRYIPCTWIVVCIL
jgi:hypothetical protein